MKTTSALLGAITMLLASVSSGFAQAPDSISYQGAARNTNGTPMQNTTIDLRLSILENSPTGPVIYQNIQTVTTNNFGLYSTMINRGTNSINTLDSVNWAGGINYLQVEMKTTAGPYAMMGVTQLVSTPYAMYSRDAERATRANDLAGGSAGKLVYQDALNSTKFTAAGTAGHLLTSGGSGAPSWTDPAGLSVANAASSVNAQGLVLPYVVSSCNGGTRMLDMTNTCTDVAWMASPNGGNVLFLSAPTGQIFWGAGNAYMTGYLTQGSDRSFKKNIHALSDGLSKIMSIRPAEYEFRTDEFESFNFPRGRQTGVIAQELQQVMPELVFEQESPYSFDKNSGEKLSDGKKYLSVNYIGLIPVTISAIQQQQQEISELKGELIKLQQMLKELNSPKALH